VGRDAGRDHPPMRQIPYTLFHMAVLSAPLVLILVHHA
jgi:hypothetical protein